MKRQNSEFSTAFVSESGGKLFNNDYFAFVELDDFACYVLADGIEEKVKSKAAKEAVQQFITTFSQKPTMRKSRIKKLLYSVNQEILKTRSKRKLEASVMIIVTDYRKVRYACAGNTRFSLYRDGRLFLQSKDHSYTVALEESGKLAKDKVMQHIERNNLSKYLGQKTDFKPFISKKILLHNLDILNVYSRGIWENIDDGELDDIISEVKEEPQELVNTVEDFLLSRQPETLDNYTFFTLFANKVFHDPNKDKKRKKIIIITIVVILILALIGVFTYRWHIKKQEKIEKMNRLYGNVIEYLQDSNFIRSEEECKSLITIAEDLKNDKIITETSEYQKLSESIVMADTLFFKGDYEKSQLNYLNAKERSRYSDNIASDYIDDQLRQVRNYIAVYDSIYLGDQLVESLDFQLAKQEYMFAKNLSTKIYFDKGREDAISSLEILYTMLKDNNATVQENSELQLVLESIAAEMMNKGDIAFVNNDFEGALVFYQVSKEKYEELNNERRMEFINEKTRLVRKKQEEIDEKTDRASSFMAKGDSALGSDDYPEAKKNYLLAEDLYIKLDLKEDVTILQKRLLLVDQLVRKEVQETEADNAEAENPKIME